MLTKAYSNKWLARLIDSSRAVNPLLRIVFGQGEKQTFVCDGAYRGFVIASKNAKQIEGWGFRSRAIVSRGKFIPVAHWENIGSDHVCCNHEKNIILVVHGLSEEQ